MAAQTSSCDCEICLKAVKWVNPYAARLDTLPADVLRLIFFRVNRNGRKTINELSRVCKRFAMTLGTRDYLRSEAFYLSSHTAKSIATLAENMPDAHIRDVLRGALRSRCYCCGMQSCRHDEICRSVVEAWRSHGQPSITLATPSWKMPYGVFPHPKDKKETWMKV